MQSVDSRECWNTNTRDSSHNTSMMLTITVLQFNLLLNNLEFDALIQSICSKSQEEETNHFFSLFISSIESTSLFHLRAWRLCASSFFVGSEINCNIDSTRVKSVNVLLLLDSARLNANVRKLPPATTQWTVTLPPSGGIAPLKQLDSSALEARL